MTDKREVRSEKSLRIKTTTFYSDKSFHVLRFWSPLRVSTQPPHPTHPPLAYGESISITTILSRFDFGWFNFRLRVHSEKETELHLHVLKFPFVLAVLAFYFKTWEASRLRMYRKMSELLYFYFHLILGIKSIKDLLLPFSWWHDLMDEGDCLTPLYS